MKSLFQDVRYGIRTMTKSPGFTIVAVAALALGIGATTAIFSVVNAILLRSLPYKDPDRLIVPASTNPSRNIDRSSVSYADYLDWKKETQVFEHIAVFRAGDANLTGDGEPERVTAAGVSEDYFAVMGVQPIIGRTFTADEFQPGDLKSVILSYGLWQLRFGGDPNILNRNITINGRVLSVAGVMPKASQWPNNIDLWAPLRIGSNLSEDLLRRDNLIWQSVARLNPNASIKQADAVMQTIARRIEEEHPESRKGWSARAIPIQEYIVESKYRRALLILLGAVVFVLLITCVNVANLLLARSAMREREFAIRAALGAGRLRLIRQLLTESLLLALTGGAAGVLLALWGVDVFIKIAPEDIPRLSEISIDKRVLIFALSASILTALAFGLFPALHAAKSDLIESLKEGGRSVIGGLRSRRIRSYLAVSEIALSLVLLIGAGLMAKSFIRLQQIDPGIKTDNVLTMSINAPASRYKDGVMVSDFFHRLVDRVKTVPGVESVCAGSALPLDGGGFYLGRVFLLEGQPEPPASSDYPAFWNVVTPGYFNTMGISMLKGRDFSEQDAAAGNKVIIINETLAKRIFPNQDPLGKRIRSWRDENILREIVGVVQDVKYLGRDDELRGLIYVPHSQDSWSSMVLSVRAKTNPSNIIGAVKKEIWSTDKDLAIADVRTMDEILDHSTSSQRFNMVLLIIFAATAMILAVVGVYGILSYSVVQRTHEIGIRIALGAKRSDVLSLVVRQGLKLVVIGTAIGLIIAFALTRVMSSLLYEVSPTDPVTFALISLLLAAAALAACIIPARRATRVDPMAALRCE